MTQTNRRNNRWICNIADVTKQQGFAESRRIVQIEVRLSENVVLVRRVIGGPTVLVGYTGDDIYVVDKTVEIGRVDRGIQRIEKRTRCEREKKGLFHLHQEIGGVRLDRSLLKIMYC